MALSTFRYPITRAYPFTWFPWVVYIGGVCLIVLFSILNFAANGYILTVHYTNDYNGTIAMKTWAQKLAFNGRVTASCQPQNLQVHSQFYTDKLALVYGLENIWVEEEGQGKVVTLPSLQYANNPLRNCSIPLLQLDLSQGDGRNAAQLGWSPWGLTALGMVTCFIDNGKTTKVNLTVRYEYVTPTIESGAASQFVQSPDEKAHSVLWWGESLLSWYWLNLVSSMGNHSSIVDTDTDSTWKIVKGSVALVPSKRTTDTTSLDFFKPIYHFDFAVYNNSGASFQGLFNGESRCCINVAHNPDTLGGLHEKAVWPDVWIEADSFAKVFYSVILADLGQGTGPRNILANASSLALFSGNISSSMKYGVETEWLKAGPARVPYREKGNDNGNLTITPSIFFTEYLCQMPTLKSAGSLILAVLVADLVFLSAAWQLLNWFAVAGLERREPTAHYCAGCMGVVGHMVDIETKDGADAHTTGYEPVRRGMTDH